MFWHHDKKQQNFVNALFWNFNISEKSQLISAVCLHFFKKYINSKIFMVQSKNDITAWWNMLFVYIFVLLHKSAILQKCKQIAYFVRQSCNSEIVPQEFFNLHIFWKNVNKQLKSADFFLRCQNFKKAY